MRFSFRASEAENKKPAQASGRLTGDQVAKALLSPHLACCGQSTLRLHRRLLVQGFPERS